MRDKDRKFAFHHVILNKMKCPHCSASNYHLLPRQSRTKSKSTRRGYAGTTSWGIDNDRPQPNVIVHPQCQPHISGNLFSPEGLTCNCDKTCKSYFNCWTGNVDDGDYVAPLEKSREERVIEAKATMEKKQRDDEIAAIKQLRDRMGKAGFSYQFQKNTWYARFGGTIWKLTPPDIEAILQSKWDTAQTHIIHTTFTNRKVNPLLAKTLLNFEMLVRSGAWH